MLKIIFMTNTEVAITKIPYIGQTSFRVKEKKITEQENRGSRFNSTDCQHFYSDTVHTT